MGTARHVCRPLDAEPHRAAEPTVDRDAGRPDLPLQPHHPWWCPGSGAGVWPGPFASSATTPACSHPVTVRLPMPASRRSATACRPPRTGRSLRSPRTSRPSCAPSGRCATKRSTSCTSTSLCPGPTHDGVALQVPAADRHLPRRRWKRGLSRPSNRSCAAWPVGSTCAARCRPTRERMALETLGGSTCAPSTASRSAAFSKAIRTATDGPTIFFIGRHEPRKGLAVLLDAMNHLPGERAAVDRRRRARDRRRCAAAPPAIPRITWLGRISDDEKARVMRGADVFCAPSLRGESFGVVLLEGMAAETPVVASDLPGYANVARADRDALLVPPGDVAALAAALHSVLTDRTLRGHSGDVRRGTSGRVLHGAPGRGLSRSLPHRGGPGDLGMMPPC